MMASSVPLPPQPADRTLGQKPSIWVSIGQKIAKYKPLNLGQGFPDFLPRAHVLESLRKTADDECDPAAHQEARSQGQVALVEALSKVYTPLTHHSDAVSGPCPSHLEATTFSSSREINPLTEILISAGAYGCLSTAFFATVDRGDEVIIIEPSFDCYTPMTLAVGGIPVYTALQPPKTQGQCSSGDWSLDFVDLESKITKKTKVFVLNTPNNPLGKVFSIDELQKIADLCIRHSLLCISDEVYEWIIFPPNKHIKIASLPGMWERTLTIGSAGKTFNITGWKTGWTIGPERLIVAMQSIQEYTINSCPTPFQEALASAFEYELPLLGTAESYFQEITSRVEQKCHVLASALSRVGMTPVLPQGGYFLMANIEAIPLPSEYLVSASGDNLPRDVAFNDWMMQKKASWPFYL
uniref:Kynurenine--oxoglutarate transaminase 3 n=1 Tax=Schistocephalus solidus TaxID=70667 RepID=A0A0X3Q9H5_SCHSO